jgi:hypothetical protein
VSEGKQSVGPGKASKEMLNQSRATKEIEAGVKTNLHSKAEPGQESDESEKEVVGLGLFVMMRSGLNKQTSCFGLAK